MQFEHPVNGHVVTKSAPWFWALLFGALYLLVNGLWTALVLWLVSAIVVLSALGEPGILVLVLLQLIIAAFANHLIASKYMRNGWTEVSGQAAHPETTRDCPYCAEPVLIKAVKCKHCSSSLVADF